MGWAVQPGERTVQGELEAALATVLRAPVSLTVAGPHRPRRPRARPGLLLRGRAAAAALAQRGAAARDRRAGGRGDADGFSARHDARSRAYVYRLLARAAPSPFELGRALWWPHALEEEALHACAALLAGHARLHRLHARRHLPPALRARRARRALGARRRRARVPHRGRHVHAPHEPHPRRDDARGRVGPPQPRVVRARCSRAARARRRGARRRRTASTWRAVQLLAALSDRICWTCWAKSESGCGSVGGVIVVVLADLGVVDAGTRCGRR